MLSTKGEFVEILEFDAGNEESSAETRCMAFIYGQQLNKEMNQSHGYHSIQSNSRGISYLSYSFFLNSIDKIIATVYSEYIQKIQR